MPFVSIACLLCDSRQRIGLDRLLLEFNIRPMLAKYLRVGSMCYTSPKRKRGPRWRFGLVCRIRAIALP
jgi:hypothetical protein